MEEFITLESDSKNDLNTEIDSKLKKGYLLKNGIRNTRQGTYAQDMVLPNNIDSEITAIGVLKLIIFAAIYFTAIFYFI